MLIFTYLPTYCFNIVNFFIQLKEIVMPSIGYIDIDFHYLVYVVYAVAELYLVYNQYDKQYDNQPFAVNSLMIFFKTVNKNY